MKKILSILLSLTILVTMIVPVFAAENKDIKILVNGTEVQFPYQKPIIQDGLLLTPAEDIFEVLGFTGKYEVWEGREGGEPALNGEYTQKIYTSRRLEFNKNENTIKLGIYYDDVDSSTGEPNYKFGNCIGTVSFELTKPLQFMGGRGMLVLDDICKATNAQLNWDKTTNIANITYDGTYYKSNYVITEEEKIKYGIYVPSLDTYLYIGMPKEEIEKLLGKGKLIKDTRYLYEDKSGESIAITYNPYMKVSLSFIISSKGTEKFGHKVGDPISNDYILKENEYWYSGAMYLPSELCINDKEDSKCNYQFFTDEKYYTDIDGKKKYKAPTKITGIAMIANRDLINELGIDMITK